MERNRRSEWRQFILPQSLQTLQAQVRGEAKEFTFCTSYFQLSPLTWVRTVDDTAFIGKDGINLINLPFKIQVKQGHYHIPIVLPSTCSHITVFKFPS